MSQKNKTLIAILNWKQYDITHKCIESVINSRLPENTSLCILDNESDPKMLKNLMTHFSLDSEPSRMTGQLSTLAFPTNLGFAKAYNHFFETVIPNLLPTDQIILLNNDTIVEPKFVQHLQSKVDAETKTEMIAATMLSINDRTLVDNLGATLYRSGMSHTRMGSGHKLFCPSGGAALYTVRLLKTVHTITGYFFDTTYFCYNEDIELGYRARLLGYKTAHAENAIIYHHRSISSGGPFNDFILYHGLRNTLFNIIKLTPWQLLILHFPYIFILQAGIFVRYITQLKFQLTFKVYFDVLRAFPRLLTERRLIQKSRQISVPELNNLIQPKLFNSAYLAHSLKTLLKKPSLPSTPHHPLTTRSVLPTSTDLESSPRWPLKSSRSRTKLVA